ncbi:Acyl-protein thioesterase [Lachnellula hyalina]|uniref:Acyl-protein thioesterase n=1 Tax=Lachnellula hyalina TaxID=1316788 RepID=A0A8H8R0J3_9HELO|nr:Acyl-protein thioesterase [Lachnellula hyalina]TVY24679.1 Acyl-protein thioesterase [Lachnellula hyalina]
MVSQGENALLGHTSGEPSKLGQVSPVPDSPRASRAKDVPGQFPDPIIVSPHQEHKQTFIILHGRGSTAERFAPPLLSMITPSGETLQTAFPHAKLIFLTASRNRATIYKRSLTHQWFDHWHMEEFSKRQELMRAGLRKSAGYVHGILEREIREVGEENVVLWGLSQGCATSLVSLLTWDGKAFAATVGMCGYLPFANHIEDIVKGGSEEDGEDLFGEDERDNDDDPFCNSGDENDGRNGFENDRITKQDLPMQAVTFLRDEIEMEDKAGMVFRDVPVFMGHGTEDEKVPIERGREARTCLDLLGADVQMVEYEGLGHWYSEEMLGNIFGFLEEKLCLS